MTWRRIAPWVIGVIALVAIFINLPRTTLGLDWLPDEILGAEFRTVLGLDLQGGLRVTLEVQPQDGQEVTEDDLALLAQRVEETIRSQGSAEIDAHEVGLAVLEPLRELDEVAYLRFASVYQAFDSLEDFEASIRDLRADHA